jgi:hypothetical protein
MKNLNSKINCIDENEYSSLWKEIDKILITNLFFNQTCKCVFALIQVLEWIIFNLTIFY